MQHASSSFLVGNISNFEEMAHTLGDDRPYPSQDALAQLGAAQMTELLDLILDTVLEDNVVTLAEGLIGAYHSMAQRLEREADRARDQVKMLSRDFDGTEIADFELQEATTRAHKASLAVIAVETVRDAAHETYSAATGNVWTAWRGNVRPSTATAAQIQARDMIRGREAAKHALVNPQGTLIGFRGSPKANSPTDASRIFDCLNAVRTRYPDMILATTGANGAEKLAIKWANEKKVTVVLSPANFDTHGKAAPFKAGDQILDLDPKLCVTIAQSLESPRGEEPQPFGPALNFGQKAEQRGIRHMRVTAKA